MAVSVSTDPETGLQTFVVQIDKQLKPELIGGLMREALIEVTQQVAQDWIEKNKSELLASLDMKAIANMVLLEVAKQTKEDLIKPRYNMIGGHSDEF